MAMAAQKLRGHRHGPSRLRPKSLICHGHAACFVWGMAKSFREMVCWQLAFELRERIVALMDNSPQARRDFKFRDQIHDSSKSVPSNIAEGYGRYRPADTIRFLDISAGSLEETEDHLRDGVACSYFNPEEVGPLIRLVARCRTAMNRWRSYLESVRHDPRFSKPSRPRRKPRKKNEPS